MNKDEMIEEMAKIANFSAFDFTQGTIQSKTIYTAMAEALYNANCRIIAEDEIVIKKSEYETLKAQNDTLELSVKDLRYRNAQFANANKLFAKRNDELLDELQGAIRIKEKTAREILQGFKTRIKYMPKNNFTRLEIDWEIAILAKKHSNEEERNR